MLIVKPPTNDEVEMVQLLALIDLRVGKAVGCQALSLDKAHKGRNFGL
jgi:hypothetical protein